MGRYKSAYQAYPTVTSTAETLIFVVSPDGRQNVWLIVSQSIVDTPRGSNLLDPPISKARRKELRAV